MNHGYFTDDEIALVADNTLTIAEVATILGRTWQSIYHKRRHLENGGGSGRRGWTMEEDAAILMGDKIIVDAQELAAFLGRSVFAVQNRRGFLHRTGQRDAARRASPREPGRRTILAQTCPHCGLLLTADKFLRRTDGYLGTCCRKCRPFPSQSIPRQRVIDRRSQLALQAQTLPAVNSGQPYAERDDKVLRNPDLTNLEKAKALGRTYMAVTTQVKVRRYSSKSGLGDFAEGQWIIDNPNYPTDESRKAS